MENFECRKCGTSFEADFKKNTVCCPNCKNMDFPETKLRAGFNINGFELKKKIGIGAMGQVWLAVQTSMQRYVAIKILSPSVCSKPGFIERFQGEIKNSAKLEHTNIITAFDAGCKNGFYYLASSYVDGENLEQKLIQKKRINEKEALKIALGIAEALSYSWSEFNLLHRDIKPSNIIIDKNNMPKLMDMGLSKCINEDPSLTYDGEIVGTPYYMSPEQAKGQTDLDLKSDIYSLGATLYHLVTGQLPFDGTNSVGILTKHITEPLVPPIDKNNIISTEINALIIKMMEKKLDSRIQTWYEVIGEITKILEDNNSNTSENNITAINEKENDKQNFKKTTTPKSRIGQSILTRISIFLIFLTAITGFLYYIYFYFIKELVQNRLNSTSLLTSFNIEINKLIGSIISDTQLYILGNKNYFPNTPSIEIDIIIFELFIVLIILFSGFWAASKAQKNNKNSLIHFIGGILIPIIYPIFIYDMKKKKKKCEKEIPEKKIIKYFDKLAQKGKEIESCFEFELLDDSKIYAERIIEVKSNMLVLQVYSETGDSKALRIPYTRIKNFIKL